MGRPMLAGTPESVIAFLSHTEAGAVRARTVLRSTRPSEFLDHVGKRGRLSPRLLKDRTESTRAANEQGLQRYLTRNRGTWAFGEGSRRAGFQLAVRSRNAPTD